MMEEKLSGIDWMGRKRKVAIVSLVVGLSMILIYSGSVGYIMFVKGASFSATPLHPLMNVVLALLWVISNFASRYFFRQAKDALDDAHDFEVYVDSLQAEAIEQITLTAKDMQREIDACKQNLEDVHFVILEDGEIVAWEEGTMVTQEPGVAAALYFPKSKKYVVYMEAASGELDIPDGQGLDGFTLDIDLDHFNDLRSASEVEVVEGEIPDLFAADEDEDDV